jgi:hypothetical protein
VSLFFRRQIAVAVYRHADSDDVGADGGDNSDGGDDATAGGGGDDSALRSRLHEAPGGPSDAQLVSIDALSPVAGLYVRAERLLAEQAWSFHENAAIRAGKVPEKRATLWDRLRRLLSRAALEGCATPGAFYVSRVRQGPGS